MREYLNLSVCGDCLLWLANGDDADGAALDTDPAAARAEVARMDSDAPGTFDDLIDQIVSEADRYDALRGYLARVDARESWARNGWDLVCGHVSERPSGYPGQHPRGARIAGRPAPGR